MAETAADDQQRVVLDVAAQIGQMPAATRNRIRFVAVHPAFQIRQQLQGEGVSRVMPAPPPPR